MSRVLTPLQIALYSVNCNNTHDHIDEVKKLIDDYAKAYAQEKVKEQRLLMSTHLNMRNVPTPKFES